MSQCLSNYCLCCKKGQVCTSKCKCENCKNTSVEKRLPRLKILQDSFAKTNLHFLEEEINFAEVCAQLDLKNLYERIRAEKENSNMNENSIESGNLANLCLSEMDQNQIQTFKHSQKYQ